MNPDQNQYPIDYLNQIAPESKKPGVSNKLFFIIVAAGILTIIIAGLLLLTGGGSSNSDKLQTLAARLQTLQATSSQSQKNIKSNELRSANSNLSIFLTNANRDITGPLQNNGVDSGKLDEKIVAAESGSELTAALEDARLNATFDRTYAREISYQLATVAGLMKEIYSTTNSASLKEFLETTDENLQPINKQLSEFDAANS